MGPWDKFQDIRGYGQIFYHYFTIDKFKGVMVISQSLLSQKL